ncbi:MAG: hypothetical protein FJ215_05680 [Ignavibacteria bacterium]|nr:hypothetical protein [Ignavibacteria bacterium]
MAKSKYVMQYCSYCHQETKMEIEGRMETGEGQSDGSRTWYRCLRCKHSALLVRAEPSGKRSGSALLDRENCIEYRAEKSYVIGQTIYHTEWDDMGLVTSKLKISSGVQAITVDFEKLGERRLIENTSME